MKKSLPRFVPSPKRQRVTSAAFALARSGIITALNARATVTFPYYDAFNYPEGNLNAMGGPNWVVGNGNSTFEIAVSNASRNNYCARTRIGSQALVERNFY